MKLTPQEWAAWVLMGDPYATVPIPLKELAKRIEQAIRESRQKDD